jgi:hypothetical protein
MPVRAVVSSVALMMLAGLSGCATKGACPPASAAGQSPMPDWRDAISDPDHVRLRAWRKAFVDSLTEARAHGHGAEIDTEGRLLDPDAALDGAALPAGFYRCRVIKLGARQEGHLTFVAYPMHRCQIRPSDKLQRLIELNGLQRPSGRIYPDSASRSIFLGTMILGDESKPIAYGRDVDRDMVGAIERVGEHQWRMLLPYPAWESKMDVMELVPES